MFRVEIHYTSTSDLATELVYHRDSTWPILYKEYYTLKSIFDPL